jgi:diguanylate cyclase (GGDEF)-like protein
VTLDVRTMVLLSALLSALVGLCLLLVARTYPAPVRPAAWHWTLGVGVQALGWFLLGLRGLIPDLPSIVLANTLIAAGFAQWVCALHLFGGRRPRFAAVYAAVTGVLAFSAVFTYLEPSLRGRIVTITALILVLALMGLRATLRLHAVPRPAGHRLMIVVYALGLGVLSARLVAQFLPGPPIADPFALTPMQSLVFATGALMPVIAAFAFVLMAGDRFNAELERLAGLDPLTEVQNRRSLGDLAARALAEARRHARSVAVMVVDADHFKRINDTFGHATGDEALKALVATMRTTLRGEDLLGRLGGEEFVALLPDADEAAGAHAAERLRAAVEASAFQARGTPVALRVSVGVAALVHAADDFDALVRRADQALYEAKRRGRNRVVASSELIVPP